MNTTMIVLWSAALFSFWIFVQLYLIPYVRAKYTLWKVKQSISRMAAKYKKEDVGIDLKQLADMVDDFDIKL